MHFFVNVVVAMFPFRRGVARGRTPVSMEMKCVMNRASFRGGGRGGCSPHGNVVLDIKIRP